MMLFFESRERETTLDDNEIFLMITFSSFQDTSFVDLFQESVLKMDDADAPGLSANTTGALIVGVLIVGVLILGALIVGVFMVGVLMGGVLMVGGALIGGFSVFDAPVVGAPAISCPAYNQMKLHIIFITNIPSIPVPNTYDT